jgi:hypothetical protein
VKEGTESGSYASRQNGLLPTLEEWKEGRKEEKKEGKKEGRKEGRDV